MSEPRLHHYQYAHYWLRSTFEEIPETMLARMGAEDSMEVLVQSWNHLGEQFDDGDRLSPNGMSLDLRHDAFGTCEDFFAVVGLPEPQEMTECHYVAMVVRSPDGRIVPEHRAETGRAVKSWYYTLELSFKEDFVTQTAILCAWDGDRHVNFGGDYVTDVDTFVDAVRAKLPDPPLAS